MMFLQVSDNIHDDQSRFLMLKEMNLVEVVQATIPCMFRCMRDLITSEYLHLNIIGSFFKKKP